MMCLTWSSWSEINGRWFVYKRASPELSADLQMKDFSWLLLCFVALWFIRLLCSLFGPRLSVCLSSIMRYWFCLDVTVIWMTSVLFISYKFWENWLAFLLCSWTMSPRKYLISSITMGLGYTQKTWLFFYCFCSYFRSLTLKIALHLSLRFQTFFPPFWMFFVVVKRRNVIIWKVHRKHVLWLLFLWSVQCKLLQKNCVPAILIHFCRILDLLLAEDKGFSFNGYSERNVV